MSKNISALSSTSIITLIKEKFDKIPDHRSRKCDIPLSDALMSVFAMYKLKMPSLLELETQLHEETAMENLKSMFFINTPASDQSLRDILDDVECSQFKPIFRSIHAAVHKAKVTNEFQVFDGKYLVAVDGTEMFSSKNLTSDKVLIKNHRNGEVTSHMQLLTAAIVHPEQKIVLPFLPEPIQKEDGNTKNDCETNAFSRFLLRMNEDFPTRKHIYLLDSLYAKSPTLWGIISNGDNFIANCKEGDHKTLFNEIIPALEEIGKFDWYETTTGDKKKVRYRFINNISIFKTEDTINCSFAEFMEKQKNGSWKRFSWLTDIKITHDNVLLLVKYGRTRWKIENETFNTLKNHGYNFEHNYGLGKNNLRANFAILVLLAFLSDQVNEIADSNYAIALKESRIRRNFFEHIRSFFNLIIIDTFDRLISMVIDRGRGKRIPYQYFCELK